MSHDLEKGYASRIAQNSFFAVIIVWLFIAVGCSRRETDVEAGIKTQTLLIGNRSEPESLDPHVAGGSHSHRIIRSLFEGLLIPDPVTGEPSPGVARSWDISADRLTYTFHLRPEARWSNGRPVTSDDFVGSVRRALTPAFGAERVESFQYVLHAVDFAEGRITDFSRVGVRAIDPVTLQVTLIAPANHFLQLLRLTGWMPIPLDVVARHGDLYSRDNQWTRPGNLVGNGAFVLKEWKRDAHIEVEKSPTYWDRDNVRLERVRFFPIENSVTEEHMFRAGQLHKTNSLAASRVELLRKRDDPTLRLDPRAGNQILVMNCNRIPFSDTRVRRALALAIDRNGLVRLLNGGQQPARSYTPSTGKDFEVIEQFNDDPVEARRLLEEAGFPDGKGFPRFELLFTEQENNRLIVEAVQEMWRVQLGIETLLMNEEWGVFLDSFKTRQYDVALDSWKRTSEQDFFETHRTGNPFSFYLWSDVEYDRLLSAAAAAPTIPARNSVYLQLEAVLAREMPVIPLIFNVDTFLLHPSVRGWHPQRTGLNQMKDLWLEP